MKRIYKGSDLVFNLSVNNFPIDIDQVNNIDFSFFTCDPTNYILKSKKDIQDGKIVLQWHELSKLEEGVLYYGYKYDDNSIDCVDKEMTQFYVVTGQEETVDLNRLKWGNLRGDITQQADLIDYINITVTEVDKGIKKELSDLDRSKVDVTVYDADKKKLATKDEVSLIDKKIIETDLKVDKKVDKVVGKSLISDTEIARLSKINNYNDSGIRSEINTLKSGKVDKEKGKSLISDTEITRLSKVKNYDDTTVKKDLTSLDQKLKQTDLNVDTKVDKVSGKSLISDTEIARLSKINNYDDSAVKKDINTLKTSKQDKLTSGKSIKTVNGESVLGEGNIITDEIYTGSELPPEYSNLWVDLETPQEEYIEVIPEAPKDGKFYVRKDGAWYDASKYFVMK